MPPNFEVVWWRSHFSQIVLKKGQLDACNNSEFFRYIKRILSFHLTLKFTFQSPFEAICYLNDCSFTFSVPKLKTQQHSCSTATYLYRYSNIDPENSCFIKSHTKYVVIFWILKLVNLHCNWINLLSVLSFSSNE